MRKWIKLVIVMMMLTNLNAQQLEIVKYSFDDDKYGIAKLANTMRRDSVDAGIENGKYIFQNYHIKKGVSKWSLLNYGLNSKANTGYKASITQLAGLQDYSYGLVVNAENGSNYIMFGIASNGYYILLYSKSGTTTNISNGWVKSSLVKTGYNAINELYIEKIGNNYQFFLNDVSLKTQSIELSKFSANVGLFANSNMKVGIEQLEIKQWNSQTTIPGKIVRGYTPMTIVPVAAKPVPTISKQNEVYRIELSTFNNRYGIKDKEGYRLVDPVFNFAYLNNGFFIAGDESTNSMGVYDIQGNMIIPPIMKKINMSKDKSAVYFSCRSESGFWGLVDQNGKTVLPFLYNYLDAVSEGLVYMKNAKGWGVIDLTGLPLVAPGSIDDDTDRKKKNFRIPNKVINGRIIVSASQSDGGKMGVKDMQGNWLIMPKYYSMRYVDTNQSYIVSMPKPTDTKRLLHGVIDKNGSIIIPIKYSSLSPKGKNYIASEGDDPFNDDFTDEAMAAADDDLFDFLEYEEEEVIQNKMKWGLFSHTGSTLLPFSYDDLTTNSEVGILTLKQLNPTTKKMVSFLYDQSTKSMLSLAAYDEYKYDSILFKGKPKNYYSTSYPYFAEGLMNVAKAGKWGFIDKTGKVVIPFQYDHASAFYKNATLVKKNNEWFYINRQGKKIPEPELNESSSSKELPPIRPGVL